MRLDSVFLLLKKSKSAEVTDSFRKGYLSAGRADEDLVSDYLVAISSDIHGWVRGLPPTARGASTLRRYKTSVVNALYLPGVSLPGGRRGDGSGEEDQAGIQGQGLHGGRPGGARPGAAHARSNT